MIEKVDCLSEFEKEIYNSPKREFDLEETLNNKFGKNQSMKILGAVKEAFREDIYVKPISFKESGQKRFNKEGKLLNLETSNEALYSYMIEFERRIMFQGLELKEFPKFLF